MRIAFIIIAVFALNLNTQAGGFPFSCTEKLSKRATAPIIGKWVITTPKQDLVRVSGVIEYKPDGTSSFDIKGVTTGEKAITLRLKGNGVWKQKGSLIAGSMTAKQAEELEVELVGVPELPVELKEKMIQDLQVISLEIILTPNGIEREVMDHPNSHALEEGEKPVKYTWRRYRG
jgi:hypothetical protein